MTVLLAGFFTFVPAVQVNAPAFFPSNLRSFLCISVPLSYIQLFPQIHFFVLICCNSWQRIKEERQVPAKIAKAKRGKINKFNLVVQCVSFCFQEFCFFAMVCLLSDFFLQMVLFVTVLSIDIRRMEVQKMHCIPTFIRLIYIYTPSPEKKIGFFFQI